MTKKFDVIDHTADIGLAAYGADISEAFANAAYGLFSLMTELDDVTEVLARNVEVSADNQTDLLAAWLNELIYIFEVERVLFRRFEIHELTDTRMRASCYGQRFDPGCHKIAMVFKAATYHMLSVEKKDGVRVQVLFDI